MRLSTIFTGIRHYELVEQLEEAHYRAAIQNDNASSNVARLTYASSGDMGKAIAAATLAQGGLHAPIVQARQLLEHPHPFALAEKILAKGKRVPGFGNSFFKTAIDPAFVSTFLQLRMERQTLIQDIKSVIFTVTGKTLYPNAAIITAAVCIAAGLPSGVEPMIFAYARIPAWTKLCLEMKLPNL